MSTEIDSAVSCAACGHPMDPAMAHDTDRGSCPECGSTGIAIAIGIAEEINIAGSMRVGQGPGDYERDALRRWREADAEVAILEQPLPDRSTETVIDAQRRLHAVFIDLWSLRETLIKGHAVSARDVDAAINASSGPSRLLTISATSRSTDHPSETHGANTNRHSDNRSLSIRGPVAPHTFVSASRTPGRRSTRSSSPAVPSTSGADI